MTFHLDHVVISVQDLPAASEDYRALGFNVLAGGRHSSGTTENAIIAFRDGTYIELIAPTGETATGTGMDFSPLVHPQDGFTGFALLASDLEQQAADFSARGVDVGAVQQGQRKKTDGTVIRWRMAFVAGTMSPFFIQDETPRERRVSNAPDVVTHANGVQGVAALTVLAADLPSARYEMLFGQAQHKAPDAHTYNVDGFSLVVRHASADEHHQHLAAHGDAPYELGLIASQPKLPPGNLHGARLRIVKSG